MASALMTSVPRRIPPSTSTGTRPATLATTSGRASIVAGTVSRLRSRRGWKRWMPGDPFVDGPSGVVGVQNALEQHRQPGERTQPGDVLPGHRRIQGGAINVLLRRPLAAQGGGQPFQVGPLQARRQSRI